MKRVMPVLLLIIFVTCVYGQERTSPAGPMTKQDYLKKSKSQKTAAFILLGAGAACVAIVAPGNVSLDATGPILVIGGVCVLSSIPLFIASSKNKKRAMNASAHLNFQRISNYPVKSAGYVPAFSLKLNF